ncbi:MAG: DUF433 domain-containing protein [Elainellaceae cyanobacterium]
MTSLYHGSDPQNIPTYTIGDAARYLRMPADTIRSWTAGRSYPTSQGERFFEPLITTAKRKPRLLTFTNLVEVHVLRAIRKHHKIRLDRVRTALDYVEEQFQVPHPLAREVFSTDGVNLFVERYGTLISASEQGQTNLKEALEIHLRRIEVDDSGLAIKLYPFTRSDEAHNPRIVVIDPRIAFGRVVIADTGIPTSVVAERYRAGDSIRDLAEDYDCSAPSIEEAIRCEMPTAA